MAADPMTSAGDARLITRGGLARHWGVSRQQVHLLAEEKGFPKPKEVLYGAPVYDLKACDRWYDRRQRSKGGTK